MDAIALLEGLVSIYSPTGQEAEAVRHLVEQMQAAGLRAHVDAAGNAIGECGDGPESVVLLGHIDTVPGFIAVRRDHDGSYGRGAVHANRPLATFVAPPPNVRGQRPSPR